MIFFHHVTLYNVQKSGHKTKGRGVVKTPQTSSKKVE